MWDGKDASTSANVAIWNKLSDVESQLEDNVGNVKNAWNNLTHDPTAENDVSSYEITVKSNQQEIDSLILQRNNIIKTLKANHHYQKYLLNNIQRHNPFIFHFEQFTNGQEYFIW